MRRSAATRGCGASDARARMPCRGGKVVLGRAGGVEARAAPPRGEMRAPRPHPSLLGCGGPRPDLRCG